MRDGSAVDPNLSLAEMLPPDKSDASGILQAGFALVEALSRRAPSAGPLEVTVTLGPAAWAALETETRRPYRGHATYKYTPHPGGAGAVRWVAAGTSPPMKRDDSLCPNVEGQGGQQCVHANGPCSDATPHCGFCGGPSEAGHAHPACRAQWAAGEGATGRVA